MPGVVFPVFEPEERAAVDALAQVLREQTIRSGLTRRSRSFPFLEHSRKISSRLRADGVRFSFSEISILLLDWARSCGDIELYVHQPYVVWIDGRGIDPVPDFLKASCMSVAAASTTFVDFAYARKPRRSGEADLHRQIPGVGGFSSG